MIDFICDTAGPFRISVPRFRVLAIVLSRYNPAPEDSEVMVRMRVGIGHDTHRLVEGRPLLLGGVRVEHSRGLIGHSDADVVLHAVTDALLGAAGMGDIGDAYPDTDPAYAGADSRQFLVETRNHLNQSGWRIVNLDVIIFAQEPKLGPVKAAIRANLAEMLGLDAGAVNVKAKTGEHVGHIGRAEAIGCQVVALIEPNDNLEE